MPLIGVPKVAPYKPSRWPAQCRSKLGRGGGGDKVCRSGDGVAVEGGTEVEGGRVGAELGV